MDGTQEERAGDEAPAVGFDLMSASPIKEAEEAGREIHIRDTAGEPMFYTDATGARQPVTITVCGTYSQRYKRTLDAQRKRMIKERQRNISAQQMNANQVELIIACILGWNDGIVFGGKPFGFTVANAEKLLDLAPWVREQVEEAMTDHEGFTKGS